MERIFFEKGGRSVQCGNFQCRSFLVWVIFGAGFLKWDELGSDILSVGRTGE